MRPGAAPQPALPWRAIGRAGLLVLGLAGGGLALRSFAGGLDASLLDQWVVGHGAAGQAVFVLLGAAACATAVPRQAVGFAAGYAFATAPGLAIAGLGWAIGLAMLAQLLGCALDFFWARALARGWARQRVRGRLARLESALTRHTFTTTLVVRLLPVGNNFAFSLLGGISAAPAAEFLAASAIGYLPQTMVFVLLGSGARVAAWQQMALAFGLFAVSMALGLWLYRRHRLAVASLGAGP